MLIFAASYHFFGNLPTICGKFILILRLDHVFKRFHRTQIYVFSDFCSEQLRQWRECSNFALIQFFTAEYELICCLNFYISDE